MIELQLLIQKTIDALKERNLKNPLDETHSIRDKNSIWSSIIFKCTGNYSSNQNICIYTNWKRNVNDYANQVLEKMNAVNFSCMSF